MKTRLSLYAASFVLTLLSSVMLSTSHVYADEGLQLRPLMYHQTLTPGQPMRGMLDIGNPTTTTLSLHVSVDLFKQKSNDGTLELYNDPGATAGIVPQYTDFNLEGQAAFRLYFTVDGSKLPQGDVFAVILVRTQPILNSSKQAIFPSVQVGTLLVLQNGQAGPRHAELSVDMSPLQIGGTTVSGTMHVTDPANSSKPTGFFPNVTVKVSPWGPHTQLQGPLVFAGRTRSFGFSLPSSELGLYKVTVTANDATVSRYVFLVTGIWCWLVPLVIAAVVVSGAVIWCWMRYRRLHHIKR